MTGSRNRGSLLVVTLGEDSAGSEESAEPTVVEERSESKQVLLAELINDQKDDKARTLLKRALWSRSGSACGREQHEQHKEISHEGSHLWASWHGEFLQTSRHTVRRSYG
jgi:hypothetical protein